MKRSASRRSGTQSRAALSVEEPPVVVKQPAIAEVHRPVLGLAVSESAIAAINEQTELEAIAQAVAEVFSLTDCDADLRQASLLDTYTYLYWRTREQQYPVWLQAYALTMQAALIEKVRDGCSEDEVRKGFEKMALDLAISAQAHTATKSGVAAREMLQNKSADLLMIVRSGVVQHYELHRFLLAEEQVESPSKYSGLICTPMPSSEDPKRFPPHLDEALELSLFNRARGIVDEESSGISRAERRKSSATSRKSSAHGDTSAEDQSAAELERLLGQFSLEDITRITESAVSDVLAEYDGKVKAAVADKQKKLTAKLDKTKKGK